MADENQLPEPGRLRWQCRRGMLELDYALESFLDRGYNELDEQMQLEFVKFLKAEDQSIQRWIVGDETPTSDSFVKLVAMIRESASS